MSTQRLVPIVALVVWSALALAGPVEALARAGGGQHFGGGHYGGGGYHGGGGYGGGGSGLFSLWPLFFFGHGSGFGFLIFLVVLYVIYQSMQQNRMRAPMTATMMEVADDTAGASTAFPAEPIRHFDPEARAQGIAAIKQHDPNFDERVFLDRAQTAFFKLQHAWAARNQDLARDVMSDALYERHKIQTDELIANHQVDVLENIVIGNARIVEAKAGDPFNSIAVAFTASMTDYTIDENTKQIVDGDRYPRTFTELWTFIRRAAAQTKAGETGLASTCPACGAPLKLTDGKCDFCGAPPRTTSSDWVVDTIEQA